MAYKAKIDFLWYKAGQDISPKEDKENVAKWEQDGFVYSEEAKQVENLDLNKDGKIDGQDAQIASKVLNTIKKSLPKKKK